MSKDRSWSMNAVLIAALVLLLVFISLCGLLSQAASVPPARNDQRQEEPREPRDSFPWIILFG